MPDKTQMVLSGEILRFDDSPMEYVSVLFNTGNSNSAIEKITDSDGFFETSMSRNSEMLIVPEYDGDIMEGITTRDLVYLKRHLLGKQELALNHLLLAADVDNNAKVSAADIVALRKVILGADDSFPNKQSSWRFVPLHTEVNKMSHPFEAARLIKTKESNDELDFRGIKIGDLDGDVNGIKGVKNQLRSKHKISLSACHAGQHLYVVAEEDFNALGMQFKIEFGSDEIELISGTIQLKRNDWIIKDGVLTCSYVSNEMDQISRGDTLLIIEGEMINEEPSLNELYSEIYLANDDVAKIELAHIYKDSFGNNPFELLQNTPNPFNNSTTISFILSKEENLSLTIFNVTGKVIYQIGGYYDFGRHDIFISDELMSNSGLMYYKLQSANHAITKKMLRQ